MIVLGLDPGTRVAGYGLVEAQGTRIRLVAAGVLAAPAGEPVERRLARIAKGLREVVAAFHPDAAAMEDAFVREDARAALMIGQGRGALLSVLGEAGLGVRSYPPASVKRSVAGNGRAGKDQVARMVGAILGVAGLPEPLDATDALAVAIAHALAHRTQSILGQPLVEEPKTRAAPAPRD
jgi:crossover junction endodeoxyribonuclease RuvC